MYKVDTAYILYYTYYDEGGWCLDGSEMTDYYSTATKSIMTDEEFISYASNYFSSCELKESNQWTDEYGNFCEDYNFSASIEYEYWTINLEGTYSLTFMDDIWIEDCYFTNSNVDWSALLGSWSYQFDGRNDATSANDYVYDIAVNINNITQIDNDNLQISYTGSSYSCWDTELYPAKVYVDKNFSEESKCKIDYTVMDILGEQIQIPDQINFIPVPWDEKRSWYPYLKVCVDPNEGLYIKKGTLESSDSICFLTKSKQLYLKIA